MDRCTECNWIEAVLDHWSGKSLYFLVAVSKLKYTKKYITRGNKDSTRPARYRQRVEVLQLDHQQFGSYDGHSRNKSSLTHFYSSENRSTRTNSTRPVVAHVPSRTHKLHLLVWKLSWNSPFVNSPDRHGGQIKMFTLCHTVHTS